VGKRSSYLAYNCYANKLSCIRIISPRIRALIFVCSNEVIHEQKETAVLRAMLKSGESCAVPTMATISVRTSADVRLILQQQQKIFTEVICD
jgi:hypothetical protein